METQPLIQPIKSYVRGFALWYIGLSIIGAIISSFVDLGSAACLLIAFAAASLVTGRYLKREGRAPTDQERNTLTNGSMIVWFVFNIVIGAIFMVFTDVLDEYPETTGLLVFIVVLFLMIFAGLTYLMMHLAYGWVARKQAAKLVAKR